MEAAFSVARIRIIVRALMTAHCHQPDLGGIATMLYKGANDVMSGTMTGGEMVKFIILSVQVAAAFGALSEVYSELQRAAGAAARLAELLRAESKVQAAGQSCRPARPPAAATSISTM